MEVYELSELLKLIPVDFRAEVLARELIEENFASIDNLTIVPLGPHRRGFSKEVESLAEIQDFEYPERNFVKVFAHREGIPDMIPPGIIFQPNVDREERTSEIMIEEAELHDSEFNNARTFFLPFDAEFGRQRIFLEQLEHQSIANTYATFSQELYELFWPNLELDLTDYQRASILELTMNAHHLSGDYLECASFIEKVLGHPVVIESGDESGWIEAQMDKMPLLGDTFLGVDWTPFATFHDADCVRIRIGPVASDAMVDYRMHEPFGKKYRILEFLCDLLLPVEISWTMVLIPGDANFQINRGRETAVLGYSTILG